MEEKHRRQMAEWTDLKQRALRKDFSLLAQDILDEKTKKFNESQQKEMSVLLEPLKTNLNDFRTQVEKSYKIENDNRLSLKAQVKLMMQLNETLAKEAKSISVALSGNTKKQGDLGEWILEAIGSGPMSSLNTPMSVSLLLTPRFPYPLMTSFAAMKILAHKYCWQRQHHCKSREDEAAGNKFKPEHCGRNCK